MRVFVCVSIEVYVKCEKHRHREKTFTNVNKHHHGGEAGHAVFRIWRRDNKNKTRMI